MKTLEIKLPDFTRILWASNKARKVWQPVVDAINKAWLEIEWLSVVDGVRSCSLSAVTPQQFVQKGGEWAGHGLNNLPLAMQGASNYTYSADSVPLRSGEPFVFRIVVGKPDHVIEFKRAWDAGDDKTIGRLLGYPDCCMDFYRKNWVLHGLVDTTWPMAKNGLESSANETIVETGGPPEANILWRWAGPRAVPHLPCSFKCDATVNFGEKMIQVGRRAGYNMEMDRLMEILSWPVEWSALHGIAIIKTPVLKVSTRTDATACEYIVRWDGVAYPSEGASGLNFPYSRVRDSRFSRRHDLDMPSPVFENTEGDSDWYWADNGFSSLEAMNEAHENLLETISSLSLESGSHVIDLGCGNGALLQKILKINPDIVPYGIDLSPKNITHAGILLPDFSENFEAADMFGSSEHVSDDKFFSLAIVMPGRFLETEPKTADRLRNFLQKRCGRILLYAYGDWLEQYGSLSMLAEKAGFYLLDSDPRVKASLAMVRAAP